MYVYNSDLYSNYKDRWIAAADSTIEHLASHPQTRPDITFVAEFQNTTLIDESEELACFDGGNFILGGLVLGESKYTDFGIALAEGCHNTYASTATGIGPEIFAWNASEVPSDQAQFFDEHGFYITDSVYVLRPEYLESLYYAYRATGNTTYQDWSWEAFLAINTTTHVGSGYSDIENVNEQGGGGFFNDQESFFFAEVLKYAYLIHAEDAVYQVNDGGKEQWVFNTEAQ
jgi:mannosyl-oligosaccharide alpha-1,2-mannosidase